MRSSTSCSAMLQLLLEVCCPIFTPCFCPRRVLVARLPPARARTIKQYDSVVFRLWCCCVRCIASVRHNQNRIF
ncbi:hypothetical protein ACHAXN_002928 [Cyclotella atomus]